MRLNQKDRLIICEEIRKIDPAAQIFLFGSRTDDQAKGGDIDLLIESGILVFRHKIDILASIKAKIGDQKIDLVLTKNRFQDSDPFIQSIVSQAVPL